MGFKKIIFQNRYVELETLPPFMEKNILNFHFDYLIISLMKKVSLDFKVKILNPTIRKTDILRFYPTIWKVKEPKMAF